VSKDPLGLYDDCIVVPFEIPWEVSPDAEADPQATLAGLAHSLGPYWPVPEKREAPDVRRAPPEIQPEITEPRHQGGDAAISSAGAESSLVMARVRGHPSLAISGFSTDELTLWRLHGETAPAEALAAMKLDLDGSLWDLRGQFLGLLWADETADLHPDLLRSIGANLQHGAAELLGVPVARAQEEESGEALV
jgi:hypothetical protein